jgi:enoyl-[acyl-carrier-protein] reductase (NADH)
MWLNGSMPAMGECTSYDPKDGSDIRAHREGVGKLDFVVHCIAFSPNGHWRHEPI